MKILKGHSTNQTHKHKRHYCLANCPTHLCPPSDTNPNFTICHDPKMKARKLLCHFSWQHFNKNHTLACASPLAQTHSISRLLNTVCVHTETGRGCQLLMTTTKAQPAALRLRTDFPRCTWFNLIDQLLRGWEKLALEKSRQEESPCTQNEAKTPTGQQNNFAFSEPRLSYQ